MSLEDRDILKHLNKINTKLDSLSAALEDMSRGIYGDPPNNVRGLIQRQDIDEQERAKIQEAITAIKAKNWKLSVLFGLAGGVVLWVIKILISIV
jgi:hypothetical protein